MVKHLLLTLSLCWFMMEMVKAQPDPCTTATTPVIVSADLSHPCTGLSNGSISISASSGVLPYTYTWSQDVSINTPIVTGLPSGNYCVTVTGANNCIVVGCYELVETQLNIEIQSDPVIYCDTPFPITYTLTVNVTGGIPGYVYSWSNGGIGQTMTVSPNTPTIYAVTVTDSFGCTNSANSSVQTNIPANTEPATCGLCNGSIEIPFANSYEVSGSGIPSGSVFYGPFTLTGLCPGTYQVLNLTNECTAQALVEGIDLPFTADAIFNTSIGNADVLYACTGQSIQFTAPESNMQVNWNFGDPTALTNLSTLFNPTYIYQNEGTYTVTLYTEGCTDADTLQRTVIIEQGIAPDITCASLVCPGTEEIYSTAVECDTYNWTVTGGSILTGLNTAEITVVWDDVEIGTVELTVGDCDGSTICNPVGSIQVPIISNNISINGPVLLCQDDFALYSVSQYGGVTYSWSIVPPEAGDIVWQNFNQVGINWISDGVVRVNMSSFLLECTSVNELPVEVNLKYQISGEEIVCGGDEITYSASSGLHNWTVTGNAVISGISSGTNSVVVVAGDSGSFTVSALPVNLTDYCNYPQQLDVNIMPLPATPVVTGDGMICPGNGYTYQVATPQSGEVYLWTITGGTPASGSGTSMNIVWQPGNDEYIISVVAQNIGEPSCASEPGTLSVTPFQNLQFTGSDQICAGEKVSYTATPLIDDISCFWEVNPPEAGSVINGQGSNIIEVQWNSGFSDAQLTVSACGVSAQNSITIYQTINPTIVQSGILCAGSSVQLSVVPAIYTSYQWSNTIGSGSNISITDSGNYVVTVTDTNGCQAIGTFSVQNNPLPEAFIYVEGEKTFCTNAPENVNINALFGEGYMYEWLVDDNPVANNTPIITHTGTSVVSNTSYAVQVTDSNGCQSLSNSITIVQMACGGGSGPTCPDCPICPDCVPDIPCFLAPGTSASLTVVPTSNCNTINFTNNSSSSLLSSSWVFGDGSPVVTVSDNSPQSHIYTQPGYYLARIQVTFPSVPPSISPVCALVDTEPVLIRHKAEFEFTPSCFNAATQFTDFSVHIPNTIITTWNWDFGDGTNSTEANPAHIYTTPGDYIVTLTIGDGICNSSITKTVTVNNLPDASFTIPATVCVGTPAMFTPATNPDAINWSWEFGNGASVTTQFPEQSYLSDGSFNVSLTVTDNDGCTNSGSQIIEVLPVNLGVISLTASTACEGDTIILTAPTGTNYLWSNVETNDTIYVTQSGSFKVTVTQPNGCQYTTPLQAVNFYPNPLANISTGTDTLTLCPGTSVVLNANAGPDYIYLWSNGYPTPSITIHDSNLLTAQVNFNVTVTDPVSGCFSISDPVTLQKFQIYNPSIIPTSVADYQLCSGESLTMTANHIYYNNFVWNTGHIGNSITVDAAGIYTVSVTDPYGCTSQQSRAVGVNSGGDMSAIPVGCYDFCELDTFMVPNIYANYQWLLNGSPIAGETSHEFVPAQSGDYQLQITTIWGCQNTSDMISLNLIDCLDCIVSSSFTYENLCTEVQFTSLSNGNGSLMYEWLFGDGNTSTVPNPTHTYNVSGTYSVCLTTINTAADADVCPESYCETITVTGADVLNLTTESIINTVCGTSNGSINITVAGVSPPYQYLWSDTITDEDRTNLPAGDYEVTVTDLNDCTISESFSIVDLPIGTTTLICVETGPDFITVEWDAVEGATGFEISYNGNPSDLLSGEVTTNSFYGFEPNTEYTITLTILAPPGCTIINQPEPITCITPPEPCFLFPISAATDVTDANCSTANGNISTVITGGSPPFTFEWNDQTTDSVLTNINAGSYSVTITDVFGCTASATAIVGEYLNDPVLICNQVSATEITIAWEPVLGASKYELSTDGNPPLFLPSDILQFTYTELNPETDYSFSLIATATGNCVASNETLVNCFTEQFICLTESISAILSADITLVQLSDPVTLSVNTTGLWGALTFEWMENDLPVICQDSICVFYPVDPTTYMVIVTDEFGCTAQAFINIDVRMPNRMLIPNAFSPNSDGINNIFRVAGFNIESYQLSVWNRWGQKIYDSGPTTDISIGWDGRFNNKDSELGVYVYMANVRYTDGAEENLKGNVTLIR